MKILLVGKANSGKTRAIDSLFNRQEKKPYEPTDRVEVHTYKNANGKELNLWDTAGSPKHRGLGEAYYISSDICINFSPKNKYIGQAVKNIAPDVKMINYKNLKDLKTFLDSV